MSHPEFWGTNSPCSGSFRSAAFQAANRWPVALEHTGAPLAAAQRWPPGRRRYQPTPLRRPATVGGTWLLKIRDDSCPAPPGA
ncbi:MAG TPA: hypothetical protein VKT82_05920 [Ktedonobacterales bacterium]|nr:hypothetical protein [Ktedonobacterales bacterium]